MHQVCVVREHENMRIDTCVYDVCGRHAYTTYAADMRIDTCGRHAYTTYAADMRIDTCGRHAAYRHMRMRMRLRLMHQVCVVRELLAS